MIIIDVWQAKFDFRIVVRTFVDKFREEVLPELKYTVYRNASNSWYVNDASLEKLALREDVKLNYRF